LAKEAQQIAKFAPCSFAKTTANCSNSFSHFHLISSVSQPQRPLALSGKCFPLSRNLDNLSLPLSHTTTVIKSHFAMLTLVGEVVPKC
jgi:hypothetical protein